MAAKHVNCVIFDNNFNEEEFNEVANEFREGYNENFTNAEVHERLGEMERILWDGMQRELSEYFNNQKVIFFGTMGTWRGSKDGGKIGNFIDLLNSLVEDCDSIKIWDENGHMYIDANHHDGTNHMEVKVLTNKGYDYYENWNDSWTDNRSERYVHQMIAKKYSVLPRIAENVYGY